MGRHPGEGRDPMCVARNALKCFVRHQDWIPAFAGTTINVVTAQQIQ
jgi:hypothetical protein